MTGTMQALVLALAVLGGVGIALLLPRGAARGRGWGIAACLGALGVLWVIWAQCFAGEKLLAIVAFYCVATATVVGAVMTVTRHNPVASALWFASVVVGTAGLFLLQSAQFLAAANVIVYAGAIIVMFLFVIMLAQQRGIEAHDRVAREPELAGAASFALVAIIMTVVMATYHGERAPLQPRPDAAAEATLGDHWDPRPGAPHVAPLGRVLFSEHWLSIELAGTLLLVATVGAIVIAAKRIPAREPIEDEEQDLNPNTRGSAGRRC